ncbi:MAG: hypothetical protein RR848_09255 [Oscillospiraceae bacterium]
MEMATGLFSTIIKNKTNGKCVISGYTFVVISMPQKYEQAVCTHKVKTEKNTMLNVFRLLLSVPANSTDSKTPNSSTSP